MRRVRNEGVLHFEVKVVDTFISNKPDLNPGANSVKLSLSEP